MLARRYLPFPAEQPGGQSGAGSNPANYASIVYNNIFPPQPGNNGDYNIAAIMLQPQTSGLFRISVSVSWSSVNMAGEDEVVWYLVGATSTGTPTFTNGTTVGIFGSTTEPGSLAQANVTSDAGITISGTGPSTQLFEDPQTITQNTFANTYEFEVSGIFGNGIGTAMSPFPIGQWAVLWLDVQWDAASSNATVSPSFVVFSVEEIPLP